MTTRDQVTRNATLLRTAVAVYLPTTLLLVTLVAVSRVSGIPVKFLTRDPISAISLDAPAYAGCVSNLGVLIWCSAGAICLFSAVASATTLGRERFLFLLASGVATLGLTLDDLYLLHEEVLPDHFYLPQHVVYGLYGLAALVYFVRFVQTIGNTDYAMLVLAVLFFALSLSFDVLAPEDIYVPFFGERFGVRHLFEDGFKLFGIVSWSTYYILLCKTWVAQSQSP